MIIVYYYFGLDMGHGSSTSQHTLFCNIPCIFYFIPKHFYKCSKSSQSLNFLTCLKYSLGNILGPSGTKYENLVLREPNKFSMGSAPHIWALKHVRPGNGFEFNGELFDKVWLDIICFECFLYSNLDQGQWQRWTSNFHLFEEGTTIPFWWASKILLI